MGSTIDAVSEEIGVLLNDLGEDDRRLFLEYKTALMDDRIASSPLLDQLCWVR